MKRLPKIHRVFNFHFHCQLSRLLHSPFAKAGGGSAKTNENHVFNLFLRSPFTTFATTKHCIPMTDESHTLHIKNMVCHRCILAVDNALRTLGLHPLSVELGIAVTAEELTPDLRLRVKETLETLEFELIDDRRMQTVQQMKDLIVGLVHQPTDAPLQTNLSDYLARTLGKDYGTLSKLFSEATGTTVEKYVIAQKIERAKELLTYGELTLNEIADRLGYSSTAYLSAQFKSVTGLTPTQFRQQKEKRRRPLDEI